MTGDHRPSASCYRAGCRQPGCRLEHKVAMQRYKAAREALGGREVHGRGMVGGRLTVPAGPVWRQIDQLRRTLTVARIAELSGLPARRVYNLTQERRRPTVRHATAEAIHSLWLDYHGQTRRPT